MPDTVELSAPEIPLRIEYSKAAMEQIRERAQEGLRALPRVGMGVGGLLLGERQDGKIRVLDSLEIPCSHANGPSFSLTDEERQKAREILAEAKTSPIGWYCSKTRGDAVLNDFDREFFNELLPGAGRIALIARPSLAAPLRAVFYLRDEAGAALKPLECEVEPWSPEPEAEIAEAAVAPEPVEPVAVAAPPAPQAPIAPAASSFPGLFGAPGPEPPAPKRRTGKLACVVGAAALASAAGALFVTQDSWLPKPPLTLNSAASDGSLTIRWNPEALRGVGHASLYVNDGGTLQTLPLDHLRLTSGFLIYTPKSQRVTAKLDAGETTAITAWFAPAPPTQPAASTPENVSDPSPVPKTASTPRSPGK